MKHADNLLIEMYHKSTYELSKESIMNIFKDNDIIIRCVVATVAMGLGVDLDIMGHIRGEFSIFSP